MALSTLGRASRYKDTPHARQANTAFYGLWRRPYELDRMRDSPSRVFDVKEAHVGRLDLIAHAEYGSVDAWWVIAAVNGIIDPRTDMHPGQRLLLPAYSDVLSMRLRMGWAD